MFIYYRRWSLPKGISCPAAAAMASARRVNYRGSRFCRRGRFSCIDKETKNTTPRRYLNRVERTGTFTARTPFLTIIFVQPYEFRRVYCLPCLSIRVWKHRCVYSINRPENYRRDFSQNILLVVRRMIERESYLLSPPPPGSVFRYF